MSERAEGDHSRIVNHAIAPPSGTFEIDPVHTFVGFFAQHLVVGRVRGRFEAVQGSLVVTEDLWSSTVDVTIEAASLTTLNAVRDDDLRSKHYLDVQRYPRITYHSTGLRELAGGFWSIVGDLALHGVTRPVELVARFGGAVTDAYGNLRIAFHARAAITRHEFGLTYELLKEAGGLLVGKDISLDIDVEAIRPL